MYFASHLSSNHSRYIHHGFLLWLQQTHLVAKRGETWREMSENFAYRYPFHTSRVLQHVVKSYDIGPTALLPLRRKLGYAFFIALKNLSSSVGFEATIA
jgi:hypothetical protein